MPRRITPEKRWCPQSRFSRITPRTGKQPTRESGALIRIIESYPNWELSIVASFPHYRIVERFERAQRSREREFINAAKRRRRRWLSRKSLYAGHEYLNTDGFNIVVYRRLQTWASRITK